MNEGWDWGDLIERSVEQKPNLLSNIWSPVRKLMGFSFLSGLSVSIVLIIIKFPEWVLGLVLLIIVMSYVFVMGYLLFAAIQAKIKGESAWEAIKDRIFTLTD